jgi:hypothetical protein
LKLVDELIDCMDLSGGHAADQEENEDDEREEPYDPHLTFNPYIQRMFQSIALRATDPGSDLPDFENHITNTHLVKIGEKVRNDSTNNVIKRMCTEFPLKVNAKKLKTADESLFEKKKDSDENKENEAIKNNGATTSLELNDLLSSTTSLVKVKKIGTTNSVQDFRQLADKLNVDLNGDELQELCIQIQALVKDFFKEWLQQSNPDDATADATVELFQEKSADCVAIQREYCIRFGQFEFFNSYLKAFKIFLINEARNKRYASVIESYWRKYFADAKLSLITTDECARCDVSREDGAAFVEKFLEIDNETQVETRQETDDKENVEDLLDLM